MTKNLAAFVMKTFLTETVEAVTKKISTYGNSRVQKSNKAVTKTTIDSCRYKSAWIKKDTLVR